MKVRYLLDKSAAYRAHILDVREQLEPLMEHGLLARGGASDLEAGVAARSAADHQALGRYRRDALEYLTTPDTRGIAHGRYNTPWLSTGCTGPRRFPT